MIIHHIEDDGNADLVQGLHHLFELADAHLRAIGVGGVAAVRHVIVHRVVAPVVLRFVEACLVHRAKVVAGQQVNSRDAQLLQMADGPRLRQCQELTRILGIGMGNGEVAVMHLVDNHVGRRLTHQTAVTVPPFRIGGLPVDNGSAPPVHTHSGGKHTRCLAPSYVEGIELTHQVTFHGGRPQSVP